MDFLWNIITIQVQTPLFIVKDFHHFNRILLSYSISISWPELSVNTPHIWYWRRMRGLHLSVLFGRWLFFLRMVIEIPVGAHSGRDCLRGTHLARGNCTETRLVFAESQAGAFNLFFFPPFFFFLAREQSNKIIIIIIKRHNQPPLPFWHVECQNSDQVFKAKWERNENRGFIIKAGLWTF